MQKEKILVSPFAGEIVPLSEVPDPVFSEGMIGVGFAVVPSGEKVRVDAPGDGVIKSINESLHAINMELDDGTEILIHIGIDTYDLKGEGFSKIRKPGDRLLAGNAIIEVDFNLLRDKKKYTVTPVVITNPESVANIHTNFGETVAGEIALEYRKKGDNK